MKCTNNQWNNKTNRLLLEYTRKQLNPIWTTGKERNRSVRFACSRRPWGREKRFWNILQPVSSQWGSVTARKREIDAAIVKWRENGLGRPLSIHLSLTYLQLIIMHYMQQWNWNENIISGFILGLFDFLRRTMKMRLFRGLSYNMAQKGWVCQVLLKCSAAVSVQLRQRMWNQIYNNDKTCIKDFSFFPALRR